MTNKDWSIDNFDITRYKQVLVIVIAIAFVIPMYIYLTESYIDTDATIVYSGAEVLVDNGDYTMSDPIKITNGTLDGYYHQNPIVYGDNVLISNYYGGIRSLTLYDLESAGVTNITDNNQTSYRSMWENHVVFNEGYLGNITHYDIPTTDTYMIAQNGYIPDVHENLLAIVEWNGSTYGDNITIMDMTGSEDNITIDAGTNYTHRVSISDEICAYITQENYNSETVYNLTYYDFLTEEIHTIVCSEGLINRVYDLDVWQDKIVYSIVNYSLEEEYVMLYDTTTSTLTNISVNSDYDSAIPYAHRFPKMAGDFIIWSNFYNGSWKVLNAYDVENEEWFMITDVLALSGLAYPDIYSNPNGDYVIAYQELTGIRMDILVVYLNSTAVLPIHGDGDGVPDISSQTAYNLDMIYIAIISACVGGALLSVVYVYREEWN